MHGSTALGSPATKRRSITTFPRMRHSRSGQTLVEYALILALIATVSIAVLLQFGSTLKGLYSTIDSQVARTTTGS
jgi:Flp pilus assembly pilin Flp